MTRGSAIQWCQKKESQSGSRILERLVFRLGLVSVVRLHLSAVFEHRKLGLHLPAHRRYDELPRKEALDILDARYAKGELSREQYGGMKSEIAKQ